jgi:hypothetical protein
VEHGVDAEDAHLVILCTIGHRVVVADPAGMNRRCSGTLG